MHLFHGAVFRRSLVLVPALVIGTALMAGSVDTPFLAEAEAAMAKMMAAMEIKASGNVDRDFVAMMAPHHQGAIDMAQAELRYGHNEQLRRLAQEIIVTQQQEIVAMRLAIGERPPASSPAPAGPSAGASPHNQSAPHPSMHREE